MKQITSRDNPLYKELKQLAASSQARRRAGRTLLEGIHLCEVYLRNAGKPVVAVASESTLAHPEAAPLIAECEATNARCVTLPDALFGALSQVENGIGLIFVIDTPRETAPGVLNESTVLLDNLQDPGNLGSILRSAAAAGIRRVCCGKGTVFAWSPKVLRSAMGAHFLLHIHENLDLREMVREAKVPVLATSSHADASIYDADLAQPVAWLFGNEGQGVSPGLLELATMKVAIPQAGDIESLNVAASAAVCFFEQSRQLLQKA
ncbi:RNA methyltransferase, TrmH family [Noviherbaspirillum humi]|uniref:RNA methyltransferase, TrmH family n=1 Tax=Noviherbaspirillum humi TaxID=1688639 RepID=A0A239H875_9BURK|nr:RNA methyltransferase [Noviherbaspirillum humi]SNS77238.1 RNA methyltransferase, TrmH family [Noviherbaspirillum humi]